MREAFSVNYTSQFGLITFVNEDRNLKKVLNLNHFRLMKAFFRRTFEHLQVRILKKLSEKV